MRFADSAFRHGITEQSIRHVVDTYGPADDVDLLSNPDDQGLLFVGDDHQGIPLEIIGVAVRSDDGEPDLLIIHAMPLRAPCHCGRDTSASTSGPCAQPGDEAMGVMRTKSGKIVTEELIEALAREAEAGFSPEQLHPRRMGRPPLGDGTSYRVQFRVSSATFEALLDRARVEERGVSEIARLALERYLAESADHAAADAAEATPTAAATGARN